MDALSAIPAGIASARHRYPSDPEYYVMNTVIGLSFGLAYLIEGAWENSLGSLSKSGQGRRSVAIVVVIVMVVVVGLVLLLG